MEFCLVSEAIMVLSKSQLNNNFHFAEIICKTNKT